PTRSRRTACSAFSSATPSSSPTRGTKWSTSFRLRSRWQALKQAEGTAAYIAHSLHRATTRKSRRMLCNIARPRRRDLLDCTEFHSLNLTTDLGQAETLLGPPSCALSVPKGPLHAV